jgi:hypothetical protein
MSRDSAKIFNDNVKELSDPRCNRSVFVDNKRYDNIKREVEEAKMLRKYNQPLTSKHYRCLKDTKSKNRWYAETYWKWFRWKLWFKHSLLLEDGGAVWCLGNSTSEHRAQKDKSKTLSFFWLAKIFSLQGSILYKVSDYTVWRHTSWINWVNCAVLIGNSAGLRTVFPVHSHTENWAVHFGNPTVSSVYLPTPRWHHLGRHATFQNV